MKQSLLRLLCCPCCHGDLELRIPRSEHDEVLEGELICQACKQAYLIVRGVPRMLLELSAEVQRTARAFGYEWKTFQELWPQYEKQFLDWLHPVDPKFFRGKSILDAGCGKGRHLLLAAKFQARDVTGVDLSEAVDMAYAHTRGLPNVHVVQADLFRLPFRESFDLIYSIGVLHHLPEPQQGFKALLRCLKPGGHISIWVYGRENNGWIVRLVNPLRQHITSRLPLPITNALALGLSLVLYPLLKALYRPLNARWPRLAQSLFYNTYLSYISMFSFREIHSIVFDQLSAPISHYLPREELERWFESPDLKLLNMRWHNRNSWSVFAQKLTNIGDSRDRQCIIRDIQLSQGGS